MKRLMIASVVGGALLSGAAQAALVDRGGGLIYDTVRDITWLQTATGARDIDGFISTVPNNQGEFVTVGGAVRYVDAVAWIDQFEYTNANGVTFSNWRLPRLDLIAGEGEEFCTAFDGSCDSGFNTINGELGALYYGGLNNVGEFYSDGTPTGICVNNPNFPPPLDAFFRTCTSNYSFIDPLTGETVSFINAEGLAWYELPGDLEQSFLFNMNTGNQDGPFNLGNALRKAWAVHDGDIGAVIPVPAAVWLFASGLGLLGWLRRRNVA